MKQRKTIATTFIDYINEHNIKTNINDNFWKWFGNSKILDNSGEPLIVYHGTNADITKFDNRKKGSNTDSGIRGRGFYFSPNIKTSQCYGKNLYEVYLKIENPLDLLSFNSLTEIIDLLEISPDIIQERGRGSAYHSISIRSSDFSGVFTSEVIDKGFDGILHGQEIVVFKPNQIKSINNDGTWNIDDDNIFS